jgi:hypothetical protein
MCFSQYASNLFPADPPLPQPGDPTPKAPSSGSLAPAGQTQSAGMGVGLYAIVLLGGLVAFGAYQYLQQQQQSKA